MLLSCLNRWKRANLKLGGRAALVLDGLLRCRGHMSSLESITMSIPNFSLALEHYNAFQMAPHLTELDLTHSGYSGTWQFPWAQLTKLIINASCKEFGNSYRNNLWGVLCQLENIEELRIITTFQYITPPSRPPIIRLPGLRLLEISLNFAMMFSWFTAPLLECLHIHGGGSAACNYLYRDQPYERELTALIQRSSCHIRRLALQNCSSRVEEIHTMKTLASVEKLSINFSGSLAIIQDITEHDGCICLPKLQVLQVAV